MVSKIPVTGRYQHPFYSRFRTWEWNWKTSYLHSSKYSWTFSQRNRAGQTFSCFITNRHHLQTHLKQYFKARVYSYTQRATKKKTHLFFCCRVTKSKKDTDFYFQLSNIIISNAWTKTINFNFLLQMEQLK